MSDFGQHLIDKYNNASLRTFSTSTSTNIQVQRMYRFDRTDQRLKAFVDIAVNDCLLIKGLRVMDGIHGLFVGMPREKGADDQWYDTIRCLTPKIKKLIKDVVLQVYRED